MYYATKSNYEELLVCRYIDSHHIELTGIATKKLNACNKFSSLKQMCPDLFLEETPRGLILESDHRS